MSKSKPKPKATEKLKYNGCDIEIQQYDVAEEVLIDKKQLTFDRDSDTGAYISPEAAYRSYGTLEELAKAVIDDRQNS